MDYTREAGAVERPGSVLAAGRRLLATVWEQLALRLELMALELAEERSRLVGALVTAAGLVVCVALALAFCGVGVLVAAWDTPYRLWVVAALSGAFGIAAVVAWLSLRHLMGLQSPLFRHSISEWHRDVAALRAGTSSET
jgi:uncharacterized membrane protein YqjE